MEWIFRFIVHLNTPLGTIFSTDHSHTQYFPQSITVCINRFLPTASTKGDSSAFSAQVLESQPPVQKSRQLATQLTGYQAGGRFTPTS
jgi:hypothetical protein